MLRRWLVAVGRLATAGFVGGAYLAHECFPPHAARPEARLGSTVRVTRDVAGHVNPMAALFATQRVPGRLSILSINF
jgi:hypothetical protein